MRRASPLAIDNFVEIGRIAYVAGFQKSALTWGGNRTPEHYCTSAEDAAGQTESLEKDSARNDVAPGDIRTQSSTDGSQEAVLERLDREVQCRLQILGPRSCF